MALITCAGHARAIAPFNGFAGHWTGGGSIDMADGSTEAIRCKADYAAGSTGSSLQIRVECASDSYKFQVVSNVVADPRGAISGTWHELTRQAQGDVTGRVPAPGQIQASLGGTAYGIQFSADTKGNRQAIALQAQGSDMQSATIDLRKH
jgi:hypothetical protein